MPLRLLGRDDIGAFTEAVYGGFGDGQASTVRYVCAQSGVVDTLNVSIADFGGNGNVIVVLYEQVAGAGDFTPIASITVPSGTAPQAVTGLSITVTQDNVYGVAFYGDVTSVDGNGTGYQLHADTTVGSPDGLGSVGGDYLTPADPLNSVGVEADGEFYWNMYGELSGPIANLGVLVQLEVKGQLNTPIPDQSLDVEVLTSTKPRSVLVANASCAFVGGQYMIDDQGLGYVGDKVDVVVDDPDALSDEEAVRTYRLTVIDQDA